MCLTLRKTNSDKPYDDSNIRWKVMFVRDGKIRSYYHVDTIWKLGEWKDCGVGVSDHPSDFGIHVYVSEKAAAAVATAEANCFDYMKEKLVVAKVEVEGFFASGDHMFIPSETWQRARILELFDKSGNNMTDKFK